MRFCTRDKLDFDVELGEDMKNNGKRGTEINKLEKKKKQMRSNDNRSKNCTEKRF